VSTTPKAIQEIFGAMPRSRIALETGTHSPWVSRRLSELGHEAIVAHARSVRLIGESRRKDDRLDAKRSRDWYGSIHSCEASKRRGPSGAGGSSVLTSGSDIKLRMQGDDVLIAACRGL
jgi:hypothetical protein